MTMFKDKNIRVVLGYSLYGGLIEEQKRRRKLDGRKTSLADLMVEFTTTCLMQGPKGTKFMEDTQLQEQTPKPFLDGYPDFDPNSMTSGKDQKESDPSLPYRSNDNDPNHTPWIVIEDNGYPQRFWDQESIEKYYELKEFEKGVRESYNERNNPLALKQQYENSQKGRFMKLLEHEKGRYYIFADRLGYCEEDEGLQMICYSSFDDMMNDGNPDLPINMVYQLVKVFGDHYGADWIRFGVGEPDWESLGPLRIWR